MRSALVALATLGCVCSTAYGRLTGLGADMSSVEQALQLGAAFYTSAGVKQDPYRIVKDAGANYVRLRVWNSPPTGQCSVAQTLSAAARAKAQGLSLLIDFHYSDTWADPGTQTKPATWASHNLATLRQDVYSFTHSVLQSLSNQGTPAEMVQIGNEITGGMLFPQGAVASNNFAPLASLVNEGYRAAKAVNSNTQVMVHTTHTWSLSQARWFYDGLRTAGASWDVTGLTYYCWWHGTIANMQAVVSDMVSRYGKPVSIAETGYPWTTANGDSGANIISNAPCAGYAATPAGQSQNFVDIMKAAENGGATSVFYWEPAWVGVARNGWDPADATTGSSWDNMGGFDFNHRWMSTFRWLYRSVPNGVYTIRSKYSGKLVEVAGASTVDGGNVAVWASNGCTCQRWTFTHIENGYYSVINVNSGKALEVAARGTANGDNVEQWTYNAGWNQQWLIKYEGQGYFSFINRNSGKAMDLFGWSTADGANIAQYDYWAGDSQLYAVTAV